MQCMHLGHFKDYNNMLSVALLGPQRGTTVVQCASKKSLLRRFGVLNIKDRWKLKSVERCFDCNPTVVEHLNQVNYKQIPLNKYWSALEITGH